MASRLNPYIAFPGTAREAMSHYRSVLGGELQVMTFGEAGAAQDPDMADKVMHANLQTPEGYVLMASDLGPGMDHNAGDDIAVSISGDDDALLRSYWDGLSDGGQVTMPLEKQSWGDVFGMCTDRFGVRWMVNIGSDA